MTILLQFRARAGVRTNFLRTFYVLQACRVAWCSAPKGKTREQSDTLELLCFTNIEGLKNNVAMADASCGNFSDTLAHFSKLKDRCAMRIARKIGKHCKSRTTFMLRVSLFCNRVLGAKSQCDTANEYERLRRYFQGLWG